jgi:hypothetical protein
LLSLIKYFNIAALSEDNRRYVQIAVALAAIAIVISGAALYFVYTINTVHPDPAAVPSTADSEPDRRYSGAVEQARSLARALLARENLPGLSVAVAIDGEIVWAEGFGFANVERRTPVTPRTRFRTGSVSKTLTAAAATTAAMPVVMRRRREIMDSASPRNCRQRRQPQLLRVRN